MRRTDDRTLLRERAWRFETYEERLALSAQPLADFWIDYDSFDLPQSTATTEPSSAFVMPFAAEGHGWTEVAAARNQFGLTGGKQTVAIIDSGIAWDHVALGGGLGKSYRVVGGWDFAENDANPYDDGPAGFHGTHVAGIVGAQDSRYAGVASGVDLVGLRVFDDQGNGYFSWVEKALQWVHDNRNAFENPITTVNLSLGTEWNAKTLPQWATLENELQQLAADGIFISVAAGNSFLIYNSAGLSYPAVSQYVTPVASVDASGNLSRFSQRDTRVLAAPGEQIMSTLPDHFYGGDGNNNDWGATSGTSMAAPYVGGASVLVREAMQNLGYTNITQSTIYTLFRNTADSVYDAATNATYSRLNLGRALESLVGADDYGSTPDAASSLGSLQQTIHVSGTIGRVSDQDFFRFTAGATGKATLTLSSSEHLTAAWQQVGGQGQISGNTLTLNVVAGQTYTIGVAGGGVSIGKYQANLVIEAIPAPPPPPADPPPPNTTPQPPTTPVPPTTPQPPANTGATVNIAGKTARITGSSGNDTIEWRGTTSQVIVNGVSYSLAGVTTVRIDGGGGSDTLSLVGHNGAETVVMRPGVADVFRGSFRLSATNMEQTSFAGGQSDRVWLYDSAGGDVFVATPTSAELSGAGFRNTALGCGAVIAVAESGGADTARLYDSAGSDRLEGSPTSVRLRGKNFNNEARGFEEVLVDASGGGADSALLRDSRGADQFDADPDSAWLRGASYSIRANGFELIIALATPGSGDSARIVGSAEGDLFTVFAGTRTFEGGGVQIRTEGFQNVAFDGRGGSDRLEFTTANRHSDLSGDRYAGIAADEFFTTEFTNLEEVLANVRRNHLLATDLAAADFVYRQLGGR